MLPPQSLKPLKLDVDQVTKQSMAAMLQQVMVDLDALLNHPLWTSLLELTTCEAYCILLTYS